VRVALSDPFAPARVVCVGNSANNWPPATPENWFIEPLPPVPSLPERLCSPLGVPFATVCRGGQGWSDLLADEAFLAEVASQPRHLSGALDVVVMNGGQSDVWYELHTPEEGYAFAVEFAAWLRGVGFDRVVGVTFPSVPEDVMTLETWEATVELYASDPDEAFDSIALAHLALPDCYDSTFYASDDLHLNAVGRDRHAGAIRPAVREAIGS
jgi:hypothetical protein